MANLVKVYNHFPIKFYYRILPLQNKLIKSQNLIESFYIRRNNCIATSYSIFLLSFVTSERLEINSGTKLNEFAARSRRFINLKSENLNQTQKASVEGKRHSIS